LEHAKPVVVATTELDAIREESAELVRDNKRRKFEVDQLQAVEDAAFVEKQKLDPKCIYALHGDFTKLCQKDIPKAFGAALLCPFHNSKCTPGVKDSVLKKAYAKYRYGKKDQQKAFGNLALERQLLQGVATVSTGMSQLAMQNPQPVVQTPQPAPQEFKREQIFDFKVERPKITGEALEAMKKKIEADSTETQKLGKHWWNITNRRESLNAKVDPQDLASAIGRLKDVVDQDNKLPADQVLPAMRKYVEEMRAQRKIEKQRELRALGEPPRPAGVKAR